MVLKSVACSRMMHACSISPLHARHVGNRDSFKKFNGFAASHNLMSRLITTLGRPIVDLPRERRSVNREWGPTGQTGDVKLSTAH